MSSARITERKKKIETEENGKNSSISQGEKSWERERESFSGSCCSRHRRYAAHLFLLIDRGPPAVGVVPILELLRPTAAAVLISPIILFASVVAVANVLFASVAAAAVVVLFVSVVVLFTVVANFVSVVLIATLVRNTTAPPPSATRSHLAPFAAGMKIFSDTATPTSLLPPVLVVVVVVIVATPSAASAAPILPVVSVMVVAAPSAAAADILPMVGMEVHLAAALVPAVVAGLKVATTTPTATIAHTTSAAAVISAAETTATAITHLAALTVASVIAATASAPATPTATPVAAIAARGGGLVLKHYIWKLTFTFKNINFQISPPAGGEVNFSSNFVTLLIKLSSWFLELKTAENYSKAS